MLEHTRDLPRLHRTPGRSYTLGHAHAPTPCEARLNKLPYPTVNAAEGWLNGKPPEPEGWAEAAGVLGFAPNVNTPDGLLFVKLKLVVLLLPNWKTEPVTEQNFG